MTIFETLGIKPGTFKFRSSFKSKSQKKTSTNGLTGALFNDPAPAKANGKPPQPIPKQNGTPTPTPPSQEPTTDKPQAISEGPKPPPITPDPFVIASTWLTRLSTTLSAPPSSDLSSSIPQLAQLFAPPCILRDSLLFTWDLSAPSSPHSIAEHILTALRDGTGGAGGSLSNFELERGEGLSPEVMQFDQPGAVSFSWRFDTTLGKGRGAARLFPVSHYKDHSPSGHGTGNGTGTHVDGKEGKGNEEEEWIADSLYMMLDSLHAHSEAHLSQHRNPNISHGSSWTHDEAARRKSIEEEPDVLIVGAGQTGLMLGARFGQMGLKALIIEKDPRVGDEWRRRYRILALHTPKEQHTLLYAPYPKTWPTFTPKDKLGDWFESYAVAQDLVVWTSTALLSSPAPTYDEESRIWTLHVGNPSGSSTRTVRVKHVVLATGALGPPNDPSTSLPGRALFKGRAFHASAFDNAESFKGERVLVVGAANTAADICEDLHQHGAAKIWMLQRSSTFLALPAALNLHFLQTFPQGCDVDLADWKIAGVPWGTRGRLILEDRQRRIEGGLDPDVEEEDLERMRQMKECGFLVHNGPENKGLGFVIFTRFGGHLVDVGFSDLLIGGGVEMITNTEIEQFVENGVVLRDGQTVECDSVIFATGYQFATVLWRSIFGDEVIDRAGPVWGLDEQSELRGVFRRTGHPGLYYAGGDFGTARWLSRQLGLLILARKLGYDK